MQCSGRAEQGEQEAVRPGAERTRTLVDAHVRVQRGRAASKESEHVVDEHEPGAADEHAKQVRAPVERLAAHVANVRLLGRVDDLVAAERARLPEALAAHLQCEYRL